MRAKKIGEGGSNEEKGRCFFSSFHGFLLKAMRDKKGREEKRKEKGVIHMGKLNPWEA